MEFEDVVSFCWMYWKKKYIKSCISKAAKIEGGEDCFQFLSVWKVCVLFIDKKDQKEQGSKVKVINLWEGKEQSFLYLSVQTMIFE